MSRERMDPREFLNNQFTPIEELGLDGSMLVMDPYSTDWKPEVLFVNRNSGLVSASITFINRTTPRRTLFTEREILYWPIEIEEF